MPQTTFKNELRKTILSGLAVLVPVGLTAYVLGWIVRATDELAALLPPSLRPAQDLPGLGLLVAAALTLSTGLLARNIFGKMLMRFIQRLVSRIPIIASVYGLFRQIAETFLPADGQAAGFRGVVLVEWPRRESWTLAFITSDTAPQLTAALGQSESAMVNLFVPTTPNPTSGFYIAVPRADTRPVALSVEDAFKVIVSSGALTPSAAPT